MIYVTRYRIYPSNLIKDEIFRQFGICTTIRNIFLDRGNFDKRQLPILKQECPEFKTVHSVVLQNLVDQIKDNIKALHRLKKNGKRVGRLRHKPVRSMIYEQTGFKLTKSDLELSKIGKMKIRISRPIPGTIKQIVLKFTPSHKWFVSIISRDSDDPIQCEESQKLGIDLNLENFSTDSDGIVTENPRNLKRSLVQLGRAQRKLSRKKKGSNNRRKQRFKVAKIHETIVNRRDDFLHKWSTKYVYQSNYSGIAVEKLNIKKMLEGGNFRSFNRSIADASWGKAREFLKYKAERAGISFKEIDPSYTSQTCSKCGNIQKIGLNIRTYSCPYCGSILNRDLNAAINIRNRAFVGLVTPELTPLEIRTSVQPCVV